MERRGGSAAPDRSAPPPPWLLRDRRQTPRDVQGRSSSRSPLPKLTPAFRRPEPYRRRANSYSKPIPSKLPHTTGSPKAAGRQRSQFLCKSHGQVRDRRRLQGGKHGAPDDGNGQIGPVAVGSSYIRATFSGAGRDRRSAV